MQIKSEWLLLCDVVVIVIIYMRSSLLPSVIINNTDMNNIDSSNTTLEFTQVTFNNNKMFSQQTGVLVSANVTSSANLAKISRVCWSQMQLNNARHVH